MLWLPRLVRTQHQETYCSLSVVNCNRGSFTTRSVATPRSMGGAQGPRLEIRGPIPLCACTAYMPTIHMPTQRGSAVPFLLWEQPEHATTAHPPKTGPRGVPVIWVCDVVDKTQGVLHNMRAWQTPPMLRGSRHCFLVCMCHTNTHNIHIDLKRVSSPIFCCGNNYNTQPQHDSQFRATRSSCYLGGGVVGQHTSQSHRI